MNSPLVTLSLPTISPDVKDFAVAKRLGLYLNAVIDLAQQAFPSSALDISVGQDAEDETHRYIAIDIDASGMAAEELLAGQKSWSAGVSRVCPSRDSVYFVLGWR